MRKDIEQAINDSFLYLSNMQKRKLKLIESVEQVLLDDETAIYICFTNVTSTVIGTRQRSVYAGALVLFTDKRVIIQEKAGFETGLEKIPLTDILQVSSQGSNIMVGHVVFTTATKSYDLLASYEQVSREFMQNKLEELMRNCAPDTPDQQQGASDILSQIEKLAEFWKSGILTDEEFTTKKTELLSRL